MKKQSSTPALLARDGMLQRETYEGRATLLPECAMAGWSRFERAQPSLEPHQHRGCFEICYLVRGSVEWWVGPQIFHVGPGEIFVTKPGEPHGGVDAFMHPCELYWVQVWPRSTLLQELEKLGRQCRGGPLIAAHFERLLAEQRTAHGKARVLQSREAARAALQLLVIDVLRFFEAEASATRLLSPPIKAAMQHLHCHLDGVACLGDAVAVSGLRGTQFRKRFKSETGFTPQEYFARAQMQEARRRLLSTEQPITEIAFDLGFSSSQYFATVFRKLTGLAPQTFRQRHRAAVDESKAGNKN